MENPMLHSSQWGSSTMNMTIWRKLIPQHPSSQCGSIAMVGSSMKALFLMNPQQMKLVNSDSKMRISLPQCLSLQLWLLDSLTFLVLKVPTPNLSLVLDLAMNVLQELLMALLENIKTHIMDELAFPVVLGRLFSMRISQKFLEKIWRELLKLLSIQWLSWFSSGSQ